jgi:hypothetical protein
MDTMVGHSKGQITHTRIGRKPPRSAAASTPTIIAVPAHTGPADRLDRLELGDEVGARHPQTPVGTGLTLG